jgi:hypothetical protein
VPFRYKENPRLGGWVDKQRTLFKIGKINQEQKEKLDEIGFVFSAHGKNWNVQFQKLRDYYGTHGHCELFWAVERFTFILNPPLTLHLSLSLHCR